MKKRTSTIIAGMAAAVLVLPCTAAATPKEELEEIMEKQWSVETPSLLSDTLGMEKLGERLEEALDISAVLKLVPGSEKTLEIPAEIVDTGSISVRLQGDEETEKYRLELGADFDGSDLADAVLYVDKEGLSLAIPQLYKGALALRSGDFAEQYRGSVLEEMLGELPEDIDFEKTFETNLLGEQRVKELEEAIEESAEQAEDEMTVEKREENGAAVYTVTCETAALMDVVRTSAEEYFRLLQEQGLTDIDELYESQKEVQEAVDMMERVLDEQFTVDYYVEENLVTSIQGQITARDPETENRETAERIDMTFSFLPKNPQIPAEGFVLDLNFQDGIQENSADFVIDCDSVTTDTTAETTVYIKAMENEEILFDDELFRMSYDAVTGDYDIKAQIDDGTDSIALCLDSTFADVKQGESFCWKIDELSLSVEGEKLGVQGELRVASDAGEIGQPDDLRYPMEMTEEEFASLFSEIRIHALSWASQFVPETSEIDEETSEAAA